MKPRRSSTSIHLVLIGAAALSSCSSDQPQRVEQPMKRDVYASRKDCEQDWDKDSSKCEPVAASGSSSYEGTHSYSSGHYWGPMYFPGPGIGASSRVSSRSVGALAIPRGGFGSTARSGSSSSKSGGFFSSFRSSGS